MLQYVGAGFATRDEALADAEKTLSRSGLDDFQMAEAFRSFINVLPTTTLCSWCDEPATGEPVRYAGTNHPACPVHSAEYC